MCYHVQATKVSHQIEGYKLSYFPLSLLRLIYMTEDLEVYWSHVPVQVEGKEAGKTEAEGAFSRYLY